MAWRLFATRMYHSSSPVKGASAASSPRVRKRPSAYLEVSTIGSCPSVVSLDDMAELEDSVSSLRRKPSNDEFSRIVTEISMHRRMNTSVRSRRSHQSLASSDDGRSGHSRVGSADGDVSSASAVTIPPCCCGQVECEVSRRIMQQIHDMESDLQLSAEIGQALLQRQDTIVHRSQQEAEEHAQQRDQLLARLTQTIKETQVLQRQLSQANFNLEAADQSQHALLSELDEVRHQLKQMKMHRAKTSQLDNKLERAHNELEDMRAELGRERRRYAAAEAKHKQVISQRCDELQSRWDEEHERLACPTDTHVWDTIRARLASKDVETKETDWLSDDTLRAMMEEHDTIRRENEHLQVLLRTTNDEVAELREMSEGPGPLVGVSLETDLGLQDRRSDAPSDDTRPSDCGMSEGTGVTTPSTSSYAHFDEDAMSYDTGSLHRFDSDRHLHVSHVEHRTAMLSSFIETASNTFAKIQKADIDSLALRLQRQKLAGDVGHLSRTTVQSGVRDVEEWRDHFRKAVDKEARRGVPQDSSLVSRRDFFALLKLQRESLLELARLRRCINEVHLNPSAAAKLLHEHLGAHTITTNRSWISRMLTGVLSSEPTPAPVEAPLPTIASPMSNETSFVRIAGAESAPMAMPRNMPTGRLSGAPPSRVMPRSRAAALSTSVAVHAHGAYTKPGMLKTKASQPALTEAAISTKTAASGAHGDAYIAAPPPWQEHTLRPRTRGLSDSSIHSTFLEHGAMNDNTVDRVITPHTLTLSTD